MILIQQKVAGVSDTDAVDAGADGVVELTWLRASSCPSYLHCPCIEGLC